GARLRRPRPHRAGALDVVHRRAPLSDELAGLLPDADERAALARERLAAPAAPALARAQAGDARHQIELRRPHVAERDRREAAAAEVVRDEPLVRDVVLVEAQ